VEEEIFPRLEKTEEIGKGITNLFGKNATILRGEEANEEKVTGTDLTGYNYYVFATHGILDRSVPWIKEPALVLLT